LRFLAIAVAATLFISPPAFAAKGANDNDYLLSLKKQRDGWLWETPGSAVVWQAFMDEAKNAEKARDYAKQLELLEAAVEHSSAFKENDPHRIETIAALKACVEKHGKSLNEKDVHELILPITSTHDAPKYRMKPAPRRAAFKDVEPMIQEADLLVSDGETDKAIKVYLKTLNNLNERHLRKGHELVQVVDRLTRLYFKQGRYTDAEVIVRKELKARESMWDRLSDYDPEKVELAFLLGDLALVHSGQDRLIEAEALYRTALRILHQNMNEHNYDYIVTLSDLARIHKLMGKFGEAEKEYRQCLTLAKNHEDVSRQTRGVIVGNYAKLLKKMGKVRAASEMEEKSKALLAGSAHGSASTPAHGSQNSPTHGSPNSSAHNPSATSH